MQNIDDDCFLVDAGFDEPMIYKITPPSDPEMRARWEVGVARRIAEGRGTFVGDV